MLFSGTPPRLLDVRLPEDLHASGRSLPRSETTKYVEAQSDVPAIVLCHKGLKLSQGVAARLRSRGVDASHLLGGVVAWQAAQLPTLCLSAGSKPATYIAASEPFACAALSRWIVTRLLPPGSTLLTVAPPSLPTIAERFGACIVHTPATFLSDLDIDMEPIHRLATEVGNVEGSMAHLLHGIEARFGAWERGHAAALPLFDAWLAAELAK